MESSDDNVYAIEEWVLDPLHPDQVFMGAYEGQRINPCYRGFVPFDPESEEHSNRLLFCVVNPYGGEEETIRFIVLKDKEEDEIMREIVKDVK
jgi:hypothetical protein